jgi:hypothetical protein
MSYYHINIIIVNEYFWKILLLNIMISIKRHQPKGISLTQNTRRDKSADLNQTKPRRKFLSLTSHQQSTEFTNQSTFSQSTELKRSTKLPKFTSRQCER